MDPVALERIPVAGHSGSTLGPFWHRVALIMFVAQSVLVCANLWFPLLGKGSELWLRITLLALALLTTCSSFARELPLQNVVSAVVLITLVSAPALVLGNAGFVREHTSGLLSWRFPWFVPVLWAVVVLNARGVARLILQPW